MKYTFALDKKSFVKFESIYTILVGILHTSNTTKDAKSYNTFLKQVTAALQKKSYVTKTVLFDKEIRAISTKSPLIEKTPWGGVSIKKVDTEKDFVQKLLIIKRHGILGFEIHKKKLEKLHILEGICLLLSAPKGSKKVTMQLGAPKAKVTLKPEDAHGIIALTNCVIEETSTNHLDDLVYIFPSQQVI